MAKLFELPAEQSICCIPLKHAVYCRACLTVSNSRPFVCSLCGSGKVMRLEGSSQWQPRPACAKLPSDQALASEGDRRVAESFVPNSLNNLLISGSVSTRTLTYP